MRAIVCLEDGPPESLALKDLPLPEPAPEEIRVQLRYAGVNFPDGLIVAGRHQNKRPHPFVPGMEGAGIVDKVGAKVSSFAPGDAVVVYTNIGTFCEVVTAPVTAAVKIGPRADLALAAVLPSTYGTTHHAYRQRAQLKTGEWVLVLGAGGGTGLAAVQLAKLLGGNVIAAASNPQKLEQARRMGADATVDYSTEPLRDSLRAILGDRRVDVVYDPVGGTLSEQAFRALGWNGRYLVVGFASGEIARLPLNLPLLKGAAAIGVFWGEFIRREPEVHRANLQELFGWFEQGELTPHIGARYPLERTPEAIRQVMSRKAIGKVLIEIA